VAGVHMAVSGMSANSRNHISPSLSTLFETASEQRVGHFVTRSMGSDFQAWKQLVCRCIGECFEIG
jgi:hypothetical protein